MKRLIPKEPKFKVGDIVKLKDISYSEEIFNFYKCKKAIIVKFNKFGEPVIKFNALVLLSISDKTILEFSYE